MQSNQLFIHAIVFNMERVLGPRKSLLATILKSVFIWNRYKYYCKNYVLMNYNLMMNESMTVATMVV